MTTTTYTASHPSPKSRRFPDLPHSLQAITHEPADPHYADLTQAWNLAIPMEAAAVVAVPSASDVAEVVRYARQGKLTVGVQATGHGAISDLAGDLLINTKGLDEVTVHPEGWARVGAGVKWARLIEATAPLGLAGLNGSASDVGIVGFTTCGGVGPLARTHGLASDRVRAFEVVTGDGEERRATPDEHPELFFALRGGKGAAGIVTAVEFDLIRLPEFYGGALYFDGKDAPQVISTWRTWAADLPEQANTSFVLLRLPPLDVIPPPLAGRLTIGVRFLWTGEHARGRELLDKLRSIAAVVLDDAAIKRYTEVDSVHADPVDPIPVIDRGGLLTDFDQATAETLLAQAGPGADCPQLMVEIRQLGGRYAEPPRHADAFDHREARFTFLTVGVAEPGVLEHSLNLRASLADWDTTGVMPNFGPPHDEATALRAYRRRRCRGWRGWWPPTTLTRSLPLLATCARATARNSVSARGCKWTFGYFDPK